MFFPQFRTNGVNMICY